MGTFSPDIPVGPTTCTWDVQYIFSIYVHYIYIVYTIYVHCIYIVYISCTYIFERVNAREVTVLYMESMFCAAPVLATRCQHRITNNLNKNEILWCHQPKVSRQLILAKAYVTPLEI